MQNHLVAGTGLEPAVVRPLAGIAKRVVPWAIDHPFIARPAVWNLLTGLWFVLAVVALVLGVTAAPLFLVLAVALGFLAGGMWGWVRLSAPTDRPLIFISQFAPVTPGASEAALNHLDAVERRLSEGPLGEHASLRRLPVPVTRDQAERLLDATSAGGVVFGSVRAIADVGSWDAQLLMRWPGDALPEATLHMTPDLVEAHVNRRQRAPDRHEAESDLQAPLASLIGERFEANHIDRIEGTLLAWTASSLADEEVSDGVEACLQAAERYRDALTPRSRASLALTRNVMDDEFEVTEDALRELERAGLSDADHSDLWNFLVVLAYLGGLEGTVSVEERLRFAQRAVNADPDDPTARYNLAESYMAAEQPDEALPHYEALAQDPVYAGLYYVHLGRGMLRYNRGEYAEALEAYLQAVTLRPTAQGHLFLADAHRQAGGEDEARRHYLLALRTEPTLVEAHRGYWHVLPDGHVPEMDSSLFDRVYALIARLPRWLSSRFRQRLFGWWLRLHYRRHPEDTRIHFMLGAHSLLARDFETAEERLQFAVEVFDGVDYEARSRLAIVYGLQGRLDEARAELELVRDQPSSKAPEATASPTREELRERAFNYLMPFIDDPSLAEGEAGARLYDVFVEVFEPSVGPIPELLGSFAQVGEPE